MYKYKMRKELKVDIIHGSVRIQFSTEIQTDSKICCMKNTWAKIG